jgi:hypothetical protein
MPVTQKLGFATPSVYKGHFIIMSGSVAGCFLMELQPV